MSFTAVEHSTSVWGSQPLPRLNTASSQVVEKGYRSGATYTGQLLSNKRAGKGTFTWPNGSVYEGEFVEHLRHGKGVQIWPDGSCYEGDFEEDLRHGPGVHRWSNHETYEGDFFRDRRHGRGVYTWPDNSTYSGYFYMDKKEGYGTFTFQNSTKFEGLYKEDEREGPGVLTYSDGSQDVGLWHREKLVKLCTSISGAFTMKDHPDFHYDPEHNKVYVETEEEHQQTSVLQEIINPPSIFDYPPVVNIAQKTKVLFSEGLYFGSSALDIISFDDAFFQRTRSEPELMCSNSVSSPNGEREHSPANAGKSKASSRKSESEKQCQSDVTQDNKKVIAWNNTASCIAMQKHVEKHKERQRLTSFNVEAILKGDRSGFGRQGPAERASEAALQTAMKGDVQKLRNILNAGLVDVDVADKSGHTPLLGAAVNWHQDTINCLLDYGADVNKLTDEGVSALAACHVHIYPVDCFKYNTAENDLIKPTAEVQGTAHHHSTTTFKTSPQRSSPVQSSHQGPAALPNVNSKQIQKLKQEYQATKQAIQDLEADIFKETDDMKIANMERTRKLGTLHVNRVAKVNTNQVMSHLDLSDDNEVFNRRVGSPTALDETLMDEFESTKSVRNLRVSVSDKLIDRYAAQLTGNELVVGRSRATPNALRTAGTVRRLALDKSQQAMIKNTVKLLLKRGADPNASFVPMPVLFFAVKAADVDGVRSLLSKGASSAATLPDGKGALTPLHIASALPEPEGVAITKLLLHSLANPDARAAEDSSFLSRLLLQLREEEWGRDPVELDSAARSGGRTPLHIATARDDNKVNARDVVELLLLHHADPNLLCNGQSPLSLAIGSGNDPAIDELLTYGADPNLPLTHGVGSALCAAASPEHEHRRSAKERVHLVDKLIAAGADVMAPVRVGPKREVGTAVDYVHHLYSMDKKISHMPYHSLSHAERETFTSRKELLEHMSGELRARAVAQEQATWGEEEGKRSVTPGGATFMYTGSGAHLSKAAQQEHHQQKSRASRFMRTPAATAVESRVTFKSPAPPHSPSDNRKPPLKFCYECGRSVGVKLTACSRCKTVYYCSKSCKLKGWNARHKDECIRIGGRSPGGSPIRGKSGKRTGVQAESPTDFDREGVTTVTSLMAKDQRVKKLRVRSAVTARKSKMENLDQQDAVLRPSTQSHAKRVPVRGRSLSAKAPGSRRPLQPLSLPKTLSSHSVQCGKFFSNNKLKELSSLKGFKFGMLGRNATLEPLEPSWRDQYVGQRVWIDNYSWV